MAVGTRLAAHLPLPRTTTQHAERHFSAILVVEAQRAVGIWTEHDSLLLDHQQPAITIIQLLRELGCRVALDDFGTGYSSIGYLHELPVTTIMIDTATTGAEPLPHRPGAGLPVR